jgi:large subunit ribosomal protein L30
MATAKQSKLKVTLIKSVAGQLKSHQATVRGLGLRRIRDSVVLNATPEITGMVRSAGHMLKVEQA